MLTPRHFLDDLLSPSLALWTEAEDPLQAEAGAFLVVEWPPPPELALLCEDGDALQTTAAVFLEA